MVFLHGDTRGTAALPIDAVITKVNEELQSVNKRAVTEKTQGERLLQGKEKLIELALQEWRKWGEWRAITERKNGRFCLQDTAGKCYPEKKTYRNKYSSMPYSDSQCQLIARYWHVVGHTLPCAEMNAPQWPWSAAFISWLFINAGFSKAQFMPSAAHANYIVDARDQRLRAGVLTAQQVPALPAPGDLICSGRAGDKKISDMHEIKAGKTLSHCDVVISVDLSKKEIDTIGGNVFGVVTRTKIELDESMTLNRATNQRRPWVVILRHNRQFV